MKEFHIYGLCTDLIKPGDLLLNHLKAAMNRQGLEIQEHDIIVLAESAVATAQGRIASLKTIKPSGRALQLSRQYEMDPALAEVVIQESDEIIGGINGFLLSVKSGHLLPNAGVDGSNAPDGYVTLLLKSQVHLRMHFGKKSSKRLVVLLVS